MKTSRLGRFLTAIVAILSMLYMQLAVAAYACPGMPGGGQITATSAHAKVADMSNCQGMDAAQPALCHLYGHGEPSKQSLDKTPVSDVPPFVPVALVLDLQFFDAASVSDAKPYLQVALTRTTAPPIAIRNCCFRI
ncbi:MULTISPECIES: hypothetical protein [Oxalobacteraceae]|uniref:hypothetical protein n=1 Tax=Oxalobacteraceae TaxID=75682 RepID=UPI0005B78648|nr:MULTISPECIES: hypothetical protein [Oxalobacteraceae]